MTENIEPAPEKNEETEYKGENQLIESFYEKRTLKQIIDDQIKSSPWWFISFAAHGVVIFLLTLVVTMEAKKPEDVVVVQTEMVEEVEEEEPEELKEKLEEKDVQVDDVQVEEITEEEVVEEEIEVETDVEVDAFEEEPVEDQPESDVNFDADTSATDLGLIGVGNTGGAMRGGSLGSRGSKSGRKGAVRRGGGGGGVISTVNRALAYLARVQKSDGSWAGDPDEKKPVDAMCNIAITGTATLCFLGAGHTEVAGKYRKTVQKAVKYLIGIQKSDGSYKSNSTYSHSIATMAMAEAAAMANKSATRESAQKAIDYLFNGINGSGIWGYVPNHTDKKWPGGVPDISASGWAMMAIKSGKLAHLKLDDAKIKKALAAYDRATNISKSFIVDYRAPVKGHASGGRPTMTLVGMCIKEFFGMKKNNKELAEPAKWLYEKSYWPTLPNKGQKNGANGYYSIYYGALVNFQMGGKYWNHWRDGMLACLEPTQDKSKGRFDGSWDMNTVGDSHQHGWNTKLYRTGITTFNCLAMEVFWRYAKH